MLNAGFGISTPKLVRTSIGFHSAKIMKGAVIFFEFIKEEHCVSTSI